MLLTVSTPQASNADGAPVDWRLVNKAEFDTLRLLFMREGKLASAAWSLYQTDAPPEILTQLDALTAATDPNGILTVEQRDQLESVFWAAAKRDRPSFPDDDAIKAVAEGEVLARQAGALSLRVEERQLFLDSLLTPADEAITIVSRMVMDPAEPAAYEDVLALYIELGRLCGPLWISGTTEDFPDLPQLAVDALAPVLAQRMRPRRLFIESRSEFVNMSYDECRPDLIAALVNSLTVTRAKYVEVTPPHGQLPLEPAARHDEMHRRATERASTVNNAHQAVDSIVGPLHEAHIARLEEVEADAEARRQETARAIALARGLEGFERPEPQRYGVSARGAEFWVADAVRWLGAHDAEVTKQSGDGGVDVLTSKYAISVKHYAGSVPVEEVREIFAVAITLGKTPLLFTSGSLTAAGADFATLAPVAVVRYDVETAQFIGLNEGGSDVLANGLDFVEAE